MKKDSVAAPEIRPVNHEPLFPRIVEGFEHPECNTEHPVLELTRE